MSATHETPLKAARSQDNRPGVLNDLVFGLFLPLAILLASCASHPASHRQNDGAPVDYAVLCDEDAPFQVDTGSGRPFSRWSIPWDDQDTVGLEITWLKRLAVEPGLPEFALVINEYTRSDGLLCLLDASGEVYASIQGCGLIQKVRSVDVAPLSAPQLLLYTNPGHGTGYQLGEVTLVEVVGSECRVLLTMPRYEYFRLQGDNYSFGLPFFSRSAGSETRIVCPVFRFALREQLDGNPLPVALAELDYLEYEWDAKRRVFRPSPKPSFRSSFTSDAWTWTPNYDNGETGYLLIDLDPALDPVRRSDPR
jgi:hypothetical protein